MSPKVVERMEGISKNSPPSLSTISTCNDSAILVECWTFIAFMKTKENENYFWTLSWDVMLYLHRIRITRVLLDPSPMKPISFKNFKLKFGWNFEIEMLPSLIIDILISRRNISFVPSTMILCTVDEWFPLNFKLLIYSQLRLQVHFGGAMACMGHSCPFSTFESLHFQQPHN